MGFDIEKIDGCFDMESVRPGTLSVGHERPDLAALMLTKDSHYYCNLRIPTKHIITITPLILVAKGAHTAKYLQQGNIVPGSCIFLYDN